MASGMMAMAPRTGGGLKMNRNMNPRTGEPYANTIQELKQMQAGGEQLSPFQMRRLGNAGQGEQQPQQLNRLSPGVYRSPEGQLTNAQGGALPFPAPQQQMQMPQGMMQPPQAGGMMQPPQAGGMMPFQPGQRPTFSATPGAPNFLGQLTPQQQFEIAKKQYMPQQQGNVPQFDMTQAQPYTTGIGANFGSLLNKR